MTFLSSIAAVLLMLLAGGCSQGTVVLDDDAGPTGGDDAGLVCFAAGPPLEPCAAEIPVYVTVSTTAPSNDRPITIEPNAPLAGPVTIVSASRVDGTTTLVIDDAGVERAITIPLTAWDPPLTPGEVVIARTTAPATFPGATDAPPSLFLRTDDGELAAGWIRAINVYGQGPDLSGLLHTTVTPIADCYQVEGGQCDRGLVQLGLTGPSVGFPGTMRTPEGSIEVTVISYFDDRWSPPGGACAIGLIGGVAIDARGAL